GSPGSRGALSQRSDRAAPVTSCYNQPLRQWEAGAVRQSASSCRAVRVPSGLEVIRALRRNLSKLTARFPHGGRVRRFSPALEQLECRLLPSAVIQLNSSGSGFTDGTLLDPATPALFDFRATAPGRISVLMHAEQPGMQSLLTGASGTTIDDEALVPSQL